MSHTGIEVSDVNKNVMLTTLHIMSCNEFRQKIFLEFAGIECLECIDVEDGVWCFYRQGVSTTYVELLRAGNNGYYVNFDNLSSYSDYLLFPYLVDSLVKHLQGEVECCRDANFYQLYDERWAESTIAEEIAVLKGTLSMVERYYVALPLIDNAYISLDSLSDLGVGLHSSTPRIYGYVQYMMINQLLPIGVVDEQSDVACEEIVVDIPQHVSIGQVKSWQLDGTETYESYSKEDIELLLRLAEEFKQGRKLHGVLLNDIGTIYQEGIGVEKDGKQAIDWFYAAYMAGDMMYAPTNLGDLYRKGCGSVMPDLKMAFDAYCKSVDPYAHYRIGQAYEEGWIGAPNEKNALFWYEKSAKEGHHLAIKRMNKQNNQKL